LGIGVGLGKQPLYVIGQGLWLLSEGLGTERLYNREEKGEAEGCVTQTIRKQEVSFG
jgi:hypothetical protein